MALLDSTITVLSSPFTKTTELLVEIVYAPDGSALPSTLKPNGMRQVTSAADVVTDSGAKPARSAATATMERMRFVMTASLCAARLTGGARRLCRRRAAEVWRESPAKTPIRVQACVRRRESLWGSTQRCAARLRG